MGVMYTFSIWLTMWTEYLGAHAWKLFLVLAVLGLPFGKKRVICDHHAPSLWKGLRSVLGCPPRCHGQCLMANRYSFGMFMDDIAWTLYALEMAVWTYLFLGVMWALALFFWSLVLWLMVIMMCIAVAIAGFCAACCSGGGDGCGCDAAADVGCTGACDSCCALHLPHALPGSTDIFYWGGPMPYATPDCSWYGCESGLGPSGTTGCSNCWVCFWPLAWLCYVFPVAPQNAWGGLSGYIFGTHPLTAPEHLYQGGSSVVEFFRMGWRRGGDLYSNDAWRKQVYDFLTGDWEAQSPSGPAAVAASAEGVGLLQRQQVEVDGELRVVEPVGQFARAVRIERPFEASRDSCVPSSFQDYSENNMCWICQDDTHKEFDLWVSCHHIFCSTCSSEMLRRRMPCPLCRVASSTVLRGISAKGGPSLLPRRRLFSRPFSKEATKQ